MFLALTADDRFWNKNKKLLFLGEWCRLFGERRKWENLDYKVMPYPWDDREALLRDVRYIEKTYESLLDQVVPLLNSLHKTEKTKAYWRIIIGPWLFYFTGVVYERYLCVKNAFTHYPVEETWILPEKSWAVPGRFLEFLRMISGDYYNLVLYSQIIKNLYGNSSRYKEMDPEEEISKTDQADPPRPFLMKFLGGVNGVFCKLSRRNRIVVLDAGFSVFEKIKLHGLLKEFPIFLTPEGGKPQNPADPALRENFQPEKPADEFERLLSELIPENIPKSYIEDFEFRKKEGEGILPVKPKVILASTALFANETVSFWAAGNKETGTRIAGIQHGGLYGCGKWHMEEDHEKTISDRFFSWGWGGEGNSKVRPCFGPKLINKPRISPNPRGKIAWVLMSSPRYSYCMLSLPMGPQHLSYINFQIRFGKRVSRPVFDLLSCRIYPSDYGWAEEKRLRRYFPSLELLKTSQSIDNQFRKSRLFVGTYNATSILEAFAANIPTILFWDPKYWELRSSAQSLFDGLSRAGILYHSPEEAADKVNEIYKNPRDWWRQTAIQEVRNRFCEKFARTNDSWASVWNNELRGLSVEPF